MYNIVVVILVSILTQFVFNIYFTIYSGVTQNFEKIKIVP